MSGSTEKQTRIQSPSYPIMALQDAVAAIAKIEGRYRTSTVDRSDAVKLLGYAAGTGPSNMALAALSQYGLTEKVGKGEIRVTERARSILHPDDESEKKAALWAAALSPQLFQNLRGRFHDVLVPPEEGVSTYLNRQGFNPSAVRPAARAFLQTMNYLQQIGEVKSSGASPSASQQSEPSPSNGAAVTYGGARVGDLIQWESGGALCLERPMRVRMVTEDGGWVAVEGSETGIPMSQVIVEERGVTAQASQKLPTFPLPLPVENEQTLGTDLRFKLGKDTMVQVRSASELGVDALSRLLKLLEAQRDALQD